MATLPFIGHWCHKADTLSLPPLSANIDTIDTLPLAIVDMMPYYIFDIAFMPAFATLTYYCFRHYCHYYCIILSPLLRHYYCITPLLLLLLAVITPLRHYDADGIATGYWYWWRFLIFITPYYIDADNSYIIAITFHVISFSPLMPCHWHCFRLRHYFHYFHFDTLFIAIFAINTLLLPHYTDGAHLRFRYYWLSSVIFADFFHFRWFRLSLFSPPYCHWRYCHISFSLAASWLLLLLAFRHITLCHTLRLRFRH